jgi:hypothetical protein
MREHTHLPAMVGFVRKHVAQHFRANRPRRSPAVSAKLLDAPPTPAERFSEHLFTANGALGQSHAGLLLSAVRAVQLSRHLQVRSCKPNPLGADIVHVRENRRNGAGVARQFGSPDSRVKIFDNHLVHALIGGKDLDCGSAELSVNLGLRRGHGPVTPFRVEYNPGWNRRLPFGGVPGSRALERACPVSTESPERRLRECEMCVWALTALGFDKLKGKRYRG